ncbi:MAG: tetratricopeptide repeat protein [Planctomycetaceae bacterium]
MSRLLLPLVVGLLGGLAGAWLHGAVSEKEAVSRASAPATPRADASESEAAVRSLRSEMEARFQSLERLLAEKTTEGGGGGGGAAAREATAPGTPSDSEPSAVSAEGMVRDLVRRPFTYEESGRFFSWLMANPGGIDDAIARLQAEVQANPTSADLRTALASAFVGKLLTAPDGPQRGTFWAQASAAYDEALKIEPEHWQARFGKAFGTSQIPAFLGQRPAAIQQFESLMELQERKPPQANFAFTYFQLGNLYKDAGNTDKAREVWERGRRLFPQDKALTEALEVSTKR